jgi:hypothetical protein
VSIYTQAETIEALKTAVANAVHCHYDDEKEGLSVCIIVKEEVILV